MISSLERALVRIQRNDKTVVGAGFLVNDQKVLTCAHVIRDALRYKKTPLDAPQSDIFLEFPFVARDLATKARVIFWDLRYDIAGLKLDNLPPSQSEPIRLSEIDVYELKDHLFSTYGFPRGYDSGDWAEGIVKNRRANGLVKLEDMKVTGTPIEGGFSGAPVWDNTLNEVIGMIGTSDHQVRTTKVAFMIPTEMILNVWPELHNQTRYSMSYNVSLSPTKICRECLQESFGGYESEIRGICQDHFKRVFRNLKETDRLDDIIVQLIRHCQTTHQFKVLWKVIEQERPVQYEKYYPKWQQAAKGFD